MNCHEKRMIITYLIFAVMVAVTGACASTPHKETTTSTTIDRPVDLERHTTTTTTENQ